MNKIETGYQKRLEPDVIRDIAKVLGVSRLLGRSDHSNPTDYKKVRISDSDYANLDSYQKEVIDFFFPRKIFFSKINQKTYTMPGAIQNLLQNYIRSSRKKSNKNISTII